MTGKELSLGMLGLPVLIGGLALIAVLVALLAGTIPAFVLSSIPPAKALKGEASQGRRGGMLRSILVVTQFAVSIALMVGTVVVYRQIQFIRTQDLGFDKKNLLVIDNTWLLADRSDAFRRALLASPGVNGAAFTQNLPGNDINSGVFRAEGQDKSQLTMFRQLFADRDYLRMLGVKLHEGRFLSNDFATDSTDVAMINLSAARVLG